MFPIQDNAPHGKFAFINIGLIVFTFYIFFQELSAFNLDFFITKWALIPSKVELFNVATLTPFATSIFLHAGWLHIISNMWFLWVFGDNIESRLGHFPYLSFYLLSGVAANFVQYLISPNSNIPMLGASGAVAGVLGAYLAFFPSYKVKTLIPIFIFPIVVDVAAGFMLIYWFIVQVISGVATLPIASLTGGVAFWAHVGGFVFGFLIAKMVGQPKVDTVT